MQPGGKTKSLQRDWVFVLDGLTVDRMLVADTHQLAGRMYQPSSFNPLARFCPLPPAPAAPFGRFEQDAGAIQIRSEESFERKNI